MNMGDTAKLIHIPLVPVFMQSMPSRELFSVIWRDLMSANVWIGAWPLFSANAIGIDSSASANALMAYCSNVATYNDEFMLHVFSFRENTEQIQRAPKLAITLASNTRDWVSSSWIATKDRTLHYLRTSRTIEWCSKSRISVIFDNFGFFQSVIGRAETFMEKT